MSLQEEVTKMKEEYVQDTARVRGMIINATERMEKEKRKVDKHTTEFKKKQLDYANKVKSRLLDLVSDGSISVDELPAIREYLFEDSDSLDVSVKRQSSEHEPSIKQAESMNDYNNNNDGESPFN
jgi:hypothetical protein